VNGHSIGFGFAAQLLLSSVSLDVEVGEHEEEYGSLGYRQYSIHQWVVHVIYVQNEAIDADECELNQLDLSDVSLPP